MILPVAASGALGDEHMVLNRKIQSPKQIYIHACNAKANTFQTLRRDLLISIPFISVIDLFQTLPLGVSPTFDRPSSTHYGPWRPSAIGNSKVCHQDFSAFSLNIGGTARLKCLKE